MSIQEKDVGADKPISRDEEENEEVFEVSDSDIDFDAGSGDFEADGGEDGGDSGDE